MRVVVEKLTQSYERSRRILDAVDLEVDTGEVVAILGPSGSGKSTLLGVLAGFLQPQSGRVELDGQLVSDARTLVAPRERDLGLVFQDLALWPHMTVRKHLDFVLKSREVAHAERAARITEVLDEMELSELAARRPSALSGGEAQRLALARALVTRPRLLLLDEPLGALDRRLRDRLLDHLGRLRARHPATMIHVTHDFEEAATIADRVAVLSAGKIVQTGSPQEIYDAPATKEVARLAGRASLIDGTIRDQESADTIIGPVTVRWSRATRSSSGKCLVVLRPEQVALNESKTGIARVTRSWYRDGVWEAEVDLSGTGLVGRSQDRLPVGATASVESCAPAHAIA